MTAFLCIEPSGKTGKPYVSVVLFNPDDAPSYLPKKRLGARWWAISDADALLPIPLLARLYAVEIASGTVPAKPGKGVRERTLDSLREIVRTARLDEKAQWAREVFRKMTGQDMDV